MIVCFVGGNMYNDDIGSFFYDDDSDTLFPGVNIIGEYAQMKLFSKTKKRKRRSARNC